MIARSSIGRVFNVHDIGLDDGTGRLEALDNLLSEGSDVTIGRVVDNSNDRLGGPVISPVSCDILLRRTTRRVFHSQRQLMW